jgi:hypothetical protein
MSKEKTPVLAGAIPAIKHFMSRWERLAETQLHLALAINAGLTIANKYYNKMDETHTYVVAMCESCSTCRVIAEWLMVQTISHL